MKQIFIIMTLLVGGLSPQAHYTSKPQLVNDRSIFNYELLDIKLEGSKLHLKGWGILLDNQNLHGSNTHSYSLELLSEGTYIPIQTKMIATSLTKDMSYIGYKTCSDQQTLSKTCNYIYNNVGFEGSVDLRELNKDATYEIYLVMTTHQTGRSYRTPLYYAQEKKIETVFDQTRVFLNADFESMAFDVYYHTLRATSTPQHSSHGNQIRMGSSCSSSHGNGLYYKQGTRFNNPTDKSYYNNLISYYKVAIELEECFDARRRVVEGKGSLSAYIPSTFINYKGKPLTITLMSMSKPLISAEDIEIEQYSEFNPLDYASAYDKEEGDITHKIKVTKNTVITRYPDIYDVCYSVSNKNGLSDSQCTKVKVIPVKTKIRYINQESYDHAELKLWGINAFRDFLLTILQK